MLQGLPHLLFDTSVEIVGRELEARRWMVLLVGDEVLGEDGVGLVGVDVVRLVVVSDVLSLSPAEPVGATGVGVEEGSEIVYLIMHPPEPTVNLIMPGLVIKPHFNRTVELS